MVKDRTIFYFHRISFYASSVNATKDKHMVYRRTARSDALRTAARERILDAARTLFARDGYDATTMQHIVDAAGTSIGNAYFYFPNKERLLVEMLDTTTRKIWDDVDAAVQAIPAGPARVGTIIYANVSTMLGAARDLAHLILVSERSVAAIEILREISIARWRPHLTASFPGRSAEELERAATAIFGANRAVVERALSGTAKVEPNRIAREMVRWSLRALGASDREIDLAIRSAARRRVNRER